MPTDYNITIRQGADYYQSFSALNDYGTQIDLTSYLARGYVKYKKSSSSIILDLAPQIVGTTGVAINVTAPYTELLPAGAFYYDVEVYNASSGAIRILQGYVRVDPETTSTASDTGSISLTNRTYYYPLNNPSGFVPSPDNITYISGGWYIKDEALANTYYRLGCWSGMLALAEGISL